MIETGQQRRDRYDPRAEIPAGDSRRQCGPGHGSAVLAEERMKLVFRDDRFNGRQIGHLMAQGLGILPLERASTVLAALGFERDHLVDALWRHKIPLMLRVLGLAAGLATGRDARRLERDRRRITRW